MAGILFVSVIVDITNENVDRLFTYSISDDCGIKPGHHVLIPFGRSNKPIEGYVLDVSDSCVLALETIKPIIRIIEPYPILDENQILLAKWMRTVYHCTMAQALRLMIPAQLRGARIREKTFRTVTQSPDADIDFLISQTLTKDGKIRSKIRHSVLVLIKEMNCEVAIKDIASIIPNCSTVIRTLINEGVLIEKHRVILRRPHIIDSNNDAELRPVLTKTQMSALNSVIQKHGTYLLHGVTGSGKTEVYLQAIEHELNKGKGAIMLVPEISLTPQTVNRFTARFGGLVAVLHSRLSPGERFDEWRRILEGEARVVVGARSAVFAPVSQLGIIIIDEEHEHSYVSDKTPRYSAAEVAKKRCALSEASLVLGSATPSIETYFKAKSGTIELLELPLRINKQSMPNVEIVDMRAEFLNGNNSLFSGLLKQRLQECLDSGGQAILFINRRGYSNYVSCRACGFVLKCTDCDVSMTYHKFDNAMKCHYCGSVKPLPNICPECGKPYIKYFGAGTQQAEEELLHCFPGISVLRMDTDSTRGKDAHSKLLSEFASGRARVLIGTQMIAKGLDFPNVTLVGIVTADAMLNAPDYRGSERTFQLLTQVAGRAGRAERVGHVVIQTQNTEHPIIGFVSNHDFKKFYDYTIKERLTALHPPYSLFVRVLFAGEDEKNVQCESIAFSQKLYEELTQELSTSNSNPNQILSLFAMKAPIARIQGKFRYQVLLKLVRTKNTSALIRKLYALQDSQSWEHMVSTEINPGEML